MVSRFTYFTSWRTETISQFSDWQMLGKVEQLNAIMHGNPFWPVTVYLR